MRSDRFCCTEMKTVLIFNNNHKNNIIHEVHHKVRHQMHLSRDMTRFLVNGGFMVGIDNNFWFIELVGNCYLTIKRWVNR